MYTTFNRHEEILGITGQYYILESNVYKLLLITNQT